VTKRAGTLSKDMTSEKWKAFATEHYGARAQEFLTVYPGGTDTDAVVSADAYTTDQFLGIGTWQWVEAQAKTGGAPVYRYHFELPALRAKCIPRGNTPGTPTIWNMSSARSTCAADRCGAAKIAN